ncbi:hypothetical protein RFI_07749, partial [Reticulomyxa filosa]
MWNDVKKNDPKLLVAWTVVVAMGIFFMLLYGYYWYKSRTDTSQQPIENQKKHKFFQIFRLVLMLWAFLGVLVPFQYVNARKMIVLPVIILSSLFDALSGWLLYVLSIRMFACYCGVMNKPLSYYYYFVSITSFCNSEVVCVIETIMTFTNMRFWRIFYFFYLFCWVAIQLLLFATLLWVLYFLLREFKRSYQSVQEAM